MKGTPIASVQDNPSRNASHLGQLPAEEHRLPNSSRLRLTYPDAIRRIGSACEDTCCQ